MIAAIGDIHGEAARLRTLHNAIFEHHRRVAPDEPLTLVHLGDYIDRGHDSAGVIEILMALEKDETVTTINLKGNHEQMVLDWVDSGEDHDLEFWIDNGGWETEVSYVSHGFGSILEAETHIAWLRSLPTIHLDATRKLAFVHAGIEPKLFPLGDDRVHIWTRSDRFFNDDQWDNPELEGWLVLHGHTPTRDNKPEVSGSPPRRINLDTGAVYGGQLTAIMLNSHREFVFLHA